MNIRKHHSTSELAFAPEITIDSVAISMPGRVLYPDVGITKGDVAAFYSAAAQRMLPHLKDRLINSFRCPEGVKGFCFFRKNAVDTTEDLGVMPMLDESGETDEYRYIKDVQGLLTEVQMYTIEFHPWASHIATLEHPDLMVFDFDPDRGMELERIRQGVRDLKRTLDELALTAFLKTSGGKGYHVVIPLLPQAGWTEFQAFAKGMAQHMEARWPERYTSSRINSGGKIYLDWERNMRGATTVAPYSLRARKDATVSMPIAWKELDLLTPGAITLESALDRLRAGDPWESFFSTRQTLPKGKIIS
jgi:bifunctional non-homologous end joining protein LigD